MNGILIKVLATVDVIEIFSMCGIHVVGSDMKLSTFLCTTLYIVSYSVRCACPGVGGIEAEAVMLGQSVSMVLPHVVGYRLTGRLGKLTTSTDVVLTITKVPSIV